MNDNVEKVIAFRINKCDETLEEAKLLAKEGRWNGVINRLYYAAFYAVSAWLYQKGVITKTHSGTRSKFNELLIKTNILPAKFADFYSDLFNNRQDGDYEDFIIFDKEETEPLIEETENLIEQIKKLIIE